MGHFIRRVLSLKELSEGKQKEKSQAPGRIQTHSYLSDIQAPLTAVPLTLLKINELETLKSRQNLAE